MEKNQDQILKMQKLKTITLETVSPTNALVEKNYTSFESTSQWKNIAKQIKKKYHIF